MAAAATRIDRLRIDLSGGSAADGREIASLVTQRLAAVGGLPAAGDVPTLSISVSAGSGSPSLIADRIVAETLRALARAG